MLLTVLGITSFLHPFKKTANIYWPVYVYSFLKPDRKVGVFDHILQMKKQGFREPQSQWQSQVSSLVFLILKPHLLISV